MVHTFVERSEKSSAKTACDVNVGQVEKKAANSKHCISSQLGADFMVVCAAINVERTSNLSSKVESCGYNGFLLFYFLYIIVIRTLTTLISLSCTGNVRA